MKTEIKKIVSIEDILSAYSGRRLQYAIKFGILPIPESFKQIIKNKTNAASGIKNRAMAY